MGLTRGQIQHQKDLENKLELYPHLYNQCPNEDCNHIWRKTYAEECPRCFGNKKSKSPYKEAIEGKWIDNPKPISNIL